MPTIFKMYSYCIFFWSSEFNNGEPIHVHVAEGHPSAHSTKIWITKDGHCVLANNNGNIRQKDLSNIIQFLQTKIPEITQAWKDYFHTQDIKFYM